MCSFNVVSHFTNVPLEEVTDICADALFRNDNIDMELTTQTEDSFKELMRLATSGVEFSFNDKIYRQSDGVKINIFLFQRLALRQNSSEVVKKLYIGLVNQTHFCSTLRWESMDMSNKQTQVQQQKDFNHIEQRFDNIHWFIVCFGFSLSTKGPSIKFRTCQNPGMPIFFQDPPPHKIQATV